MANKNKMSQTELNNKVDELKAQLFQLRFQNSTSQLENTHQIKEVRKEIARTLTQINMNKKEGNK